MDICGYNNDIIYWIQNMIYWNSITPEKKKNRDLSTAHLVKISPHSAYPICSCFDSPLFFSHLSSSQFILVHLNSPIIQIALYLILYFQ